jgi:peptidoglycan hydrolase CwlO-like protein
VRAAVAAFAVVAALTAASGCGGSSSSADTAKTNACNAKADIDTQIATLQGLPASLASLDTAKTALQKIQKDLSTINESVPEVTGDLKDQLKAANSAFSSQLAQVTQDITSVQAATDAAGTLTTAGQHLAQEYQKAFAGVKC